MTKTQSWNRLRRTSTARSKQSVSQSCMCVATTVDVHLHLLRQERKKQTCIRGWLAERADEWLWAGTRVRFEVILCALTGRLNLGPGVAGANQTLGEQGCQVLCTSVPQPNQ